MKRPSSPTPLLPPPNPSPSAAACACTQLTFSSAAGRETHTRVGTMEADASVEALVLEYLNAKGFTSAESALREQRESSSSEAPLLCEEDKAVMDAMRRAAVEFRVARVEEFKLLPSCRHKLRRLIRRCVANYVCHFKKLQHCQIQLQLRRQRLLG